MNTVVSQLQAQVESLSPVDRVHLIEFLQETLGRSDAQIEIEWTAEAEGRLEGLEHGDIALEDEPEPLRTHRATRS